MVEHRRRKEVQRAAPRTRWPWAPTGGLGEPRRARSTRWSSPALLAEGRREGEAGPRHPRQAVASTTTRTRSASTSPSGWAGARRTFASKVESLESEAEKNKAPALVALRRRQERPGGARGRRRPRHARRARCPRWSPPTCASTSRATPRCPGIMKAKSKPIEELTPAALGRRRRAARSTVVKMSAPPARKAGIKVADVRDAVRQAEERSQGHLREERPMSNVLIVAESPAGRTPPQGHPQRHRRRAGPRRPKTGGELHARRARQGCRRRSPSELEGVRRQAVHAAAAPALRALPRRGLRPGGRRPGEVDRGRPSSAPPRPPWARTSCPAWPRGSKAAMASDVHGASTGAGADITFTRPMWAGNVHRRREARRRR